MNLLMLLLSVQGDKWSLALGERWQERTAYNIVLHCAMLRIREPMPQEVVTSDMDSARRPGLSWRQRECHVVESE